MDQRSIASLGILGVLAEQESATIRDVHDRLRHSFGRYSVDHIERLTISSSRH